MNSPSFTPVPFRRAEAKHLASERIYQGIPGITATHDHRLFALWYGGGSGEGPDNYIMVALSDDGGVNWSPEMW